jgi:hypothetical protein
MNHEKDIHENGRFHGHGQDFEVRCPPVDFSADGERTRTMAQIQGKQRLSAIPLGFYLSLLVLHQRTYLYNI